VLRTVCGVALGVLALTSDISAFAGSRLYDMNRLLSQPHPYQNIQTSSTTADQRLVAPASSMRGFGRNTTPLPGSQYRVSVPTSSGPASVVYRGIQPVGQRSAPAYSSAAAKNSKVPPQPGHPANGAAKRSFISEIVVGGFVHDPGQDNNEANTADLNLEIIFRKVTLLTFENRYLRFLFSPNPVFGGTINSDNETHTAYLAMNWQHRFESDWFVAGSFGLTVHTGNLDQAEEDCPAGSFCSLPGNRRFVNTGDVTLGSRILFRESIEFGYWVAERHGVSIYVAHMSNASLFDEDNDGMNFVGLRYRYSFD
jgi:hypothetical protein